jgi:hypothetical protein
MTVDSQRRLLMKLAVAGAIVPLPFPAMAAGREAVDTFVVDTRFAGSLAAARPGVRHLTTDGDMTRLWVEHLDAAWRTPSGVLAGTTGEDVLFVLETLAHDRGRRVLAREPAGGGAVRWLIGMRG